MPKGRVNTLMAGAGLKKASRSRYTAAGYMHENDLYIAKDQAGSARELLRDNNRIGYSRPELDDDGLPFDFFIEETRREEERMRAKQENAKRHKPRRLTLTQRIARAVRREKQAAVVCAVLTAIMLTLGCFEMQMIIDGVDKQAKIRMYEDGARSYQAEIDDAKVRIAQAQSGERIRNKAQNELGMLRGERMDTRKIYIQTPNLPMAQTAQQTEEERGLLDWLLSVADIFDFMS